MEFFQLSVGQWRSQRINHHLLFRQAESSVSEIQIQMLAVQDPHVVSTCHLHHVDPSLAIGGAEVTWTESTAKD